MGFDTILTIVLIVAFVLVLGGGLYFYLRDKTLSQIRADVYQLFLKAEHNPNFNKAGKTKMKWVLSRARMLLPDWAQLLVTDALLEKVIQAWFDAVKDLLDDGKFNGTNKEV